MSSIPGISTQIPKQRVLLVDDSRIVRTTLSRLIRKSFDVREEANGEAGWQAITTDPSIVVVFSDLQMPVLDGFALLERIRQSEDPRIRSMPVIVISGDEEDATKKRARARSEEHTSELQSLAYLVCRLLLEKKKQPTGRATAELRPR